MTYISAKTVTRAIKNLREVTHTGVKNGNINSLPAYLLLKWLECSETKWQTKDEIYKAKGNQDPIAKIHELGGIFSQDEYIEKGGCVFFSAFSNAEDNRFNKGSEFNKLFGRFKDTVDNSIADVLLDKGDQNKYRFTLEATKSIHRTYSKKFPLDATLCWVYRFYNFQTKPSIEDLRNLFIQDYKLSENNVRDIFDFNPSLTIEEGDRITGQEIRKLLDLKSDNISSLTKNSELIKYQNKVILTSRSYKAMDNKKLMLLLQKYKQIILTGVPGSGKSYLVDQISKDFDEVIKVQFHPTYSYQDFVIGKTIKDGNVVEEIGPLIIAINKAIKDAKKNFLLVIDEVNRGNTSAIFGELLHILDRDKSIELKIGEKLQSIQLPDNLKIIATMNSTDRTIALIDYAVRRRFLFIELMPDYDLIDEKSTLAGKVVLGNFLKKINANISKVTGNPDYILGHSFFIKGTKDWNSEDISEVLQYKISPMLREYVHTNINQLEEIIPQKILNARDDSLIQLIEDYINDAEPNNKNI